MAFIRVQTDVEDEFISIRLPANPAETFIKGELLLIFDGVLTKAFDDDMPTHICVKDTAPTKARTALLPVVPVDRTIFYETEAAFPLRDIKPGERMLIDDDGLRAGKSDENGCLVLFEKHGITAGSKLVVKIAPSVGEV